MRTGRAAAVEVSDLYFAYAKNDVLTGVNLTIHRGEVVCLLGPNGVGKTTLVENLLGMLTPQRGSVRVLGKNPLKADARLRARVGLVQQNWSDHGKWRISDHLGWLHAQYSTEVDDVRLPEEALASVGLEEKLGSTMGQLSGGQRRSVDFASAIMHHPQLLLLDEPTTGLDPVAKARLHDLIMEQVDGESAVLMTTHDLAEAEKLASRILIMSEGRIIADGTVPELRQQFSGQSEVSWRDASGTRHVHSTDEPRDFIIHSVPEDAKELRVHSADLEDTYLKIIRHHEELAEKESHVTH